MKNKSIFDAESESVRKCGTKNDVASNFNKEKLQQIVKIISKNLLFTFCLRSENGKKRRKKCDR